MAFCEVCDTESELPFCTRCGSAMSDSPRGMSFLVAGSRVFLSQILAVIVAASLLLSMIAWRNIDLRIQFTASILIIGLSFLVARSPRTVTYSRSISNWTKRSVNSTSQGNGFSKWILCPVFVLLDLATKATSRIPGLFLRAACRFIIWAAIALTALCVLLASILALLYIGVIIIAIVLALVFICIGFWLLSVIFRILNPGDSGKPPLVGGVPIFTKKSGEFVFRTKSDGSKHLVREALFEESVGPLHKGMFGIQESRNILEPNIEIKENIGLFGRDEQHPFEISSGGRTIGHLEPKDELFTSRSEQTYTFESEKEKGDD